MCSIHELASFYTSEDTFNPEKWMLLWRSLILSSFPGSTYAPYLHYIRVLSLRDLENLLDERFFKVTGRHDFFTGKLEQFSELYNTLERSKSKYEPDQSSAIRQTSIAIGDHITKYCDTILKSTGRKSVLEELDCRDVPTQALHQMIPRITGLKSLRLWDGCHLDSVAPLIRINCPRFESLTIYLWVSGDVDEDFAEFLNDLQPQTLKHLQVLSFIDCESLTAAALSKHNASLLSLDIGSRSVEFVQSLPLIGSCSQLTLLHVSLGNLGAATSKHTLTEVSNWLSTCTSLTDLKFCHGLGDLGPKILVSVLQSGINLTRLHLEYYNGASAQDFHRALVAQATSLEYLTLSGDAEDMDPDDLVTSISKLTKLQKLHLLSISNYFADKHIRLVANSLPLLQELVVGGWCVTDFVWSVLSTLQSLRRLDLNTFSTFSLTGILDYIDCLSEGNKGLVLSITGQDPFHWLNQSEQDIVQATLAAKVDGRFEFTVGRGEAFLFLARLDPVGKRAARTDLLEAKMFQDNSLSDD